jgi:hypothetical protein
MGWSNRRQETMQNEELHNLYSSPNIIRIIRSREILVGNVARMGEMRNAYFPKDA